MDQHFIRSETVRVPRFEALATVEEMIDLKEALVIGFANFPDALYLLARGFKVKGVDVSVAGIDRYIELARARGLEGQLECIKSDVRELAMLDQKVGLVLSDLTIHTLKKDERRATIDMLKGSTINGGYHLISGLSEHDPNFRDGSCLLSQQEMRGWYNDWQIISSYEQSEGESHTHAWGEVHPFPHKISYILARKPHEKNECP